MAEESVIIDIKVSSDEAVQAIVAAQKHVEELTAAKKAAEQQDGKNSESVARLTAQIKAENDVIRANQKILVDNIKTQQAESDSLNQMRAQLRNLTKQYDDLSKAEREGAKGHELLDKIQLLNAEISDAEEASGRFQRNVGNYPNVLSLAGGKMQKFAKLAQGLTGNARTMGEAFRNGGKGVAAMGKQLWSLMKIPVVAIIAAIAAVIMKVVQAIKKNGAATSSMKKAFAALKPILNVINKVIGLIAEAIAKLVEWISKATAALFSWIPGMKEAADAQMELEERTEALEEAERRYVISHAKNERNISQLRIKANEEEGETFETRKEYLREAIKLERADLKARIEIAREKFLLARMQADLDNDTSEETKQQLAELEAAIYEAQKDFNEFLSSSEKEFKDFQKNERKRMAAAAKQAAQERKERQKKELTEVRALEDAIVAAMKEGAEKAKKEARLAAERQIEDLKKRLTDEKDLTVKARNAIAERIILIEAAMHLQIEQIDKDAASKRLQKNIEQMTEYWTARLTLAKKFSEEEMRAREGIINQETTAELLAIDERFQKGELTELQYETLRAAARKKADEEMKQLRKAAADEEQRQIQVEWENKINAAVEYGTERARLEMEMRKEQLDALHQMEGESEADFRARQLAAQKAYTDSCKALDQQQLSNRYATAQAAAQVTGNLSQMLEAAAGENEELAKAAKVLALAQVAIEQGVAIAKGVAGAMDVPFPYNLGAIATVVGSVLTIMTSAISTINSAKFADGGYVRGAGTATSDSIPARLSNGESVINARSTAKYFNLLSAINQDGGGAAFSNATRHAFATGGYVSTDALLSGVRADEMAQAMRDAVSDVHPVVSVREIARVNERVEVKERLY